MTATENLQVKLARFPDGEPTPDDFEVAAGPVPECGAGQVLCETLFLSLDPYMRSQIAGRHISGTIAPGDVMLGETVARVVQCDSGAFQVGDLVRCQGGWQQYSVHSPEALHRLPANVVSPSYYLSVLGMPGLTAYSGLIWQAQPKAGDVVVVAAATGGVGAMVGQLAKLRGCRVVGIAGGETKCRYAVEQLGYDACIDRRAGDIGWIESELDRLCPEGVDIYFDLVGGALLNAVSQRLAVGARVVLCGIMSELNSSDRGAGPHPGLWIKARASVYGLVVYDFESRRDEFIAACLPAVESGDIQCLEDCYEGLARAPEAFCRLMRGENMGKVVIKVA
ncbi:NADP-dependent oxidoreductase [Parahaliea maris]|uniref:NADP-dependent oxidoreductase n=1 Tax=Parahaliea maris TaxID=2716870 RepID=A0A5C8ZW52_9GAMM|nr:NADP-dependent oxidoreductase [Parahaliea maris]TXS91994.1 NADP-dependent oxidoreductase [Parahaliea maris]